MQTERGQQREDELSPVSVSCMQEYEAVLHGMPINKASRMFSVPYSTLRDRISGKIKFETTRSGPEPLFSSSQEEERTQRQKIQTSRIEQYWHNCDC